ncbi:L,D-transpeptidase family protein [Qipengyuania gelatinilytica]|uniref:L,D-transpeptidase family protein n=1 Tax=Qipengyuania gelatinilytica TaxID=2867231 RepID=A0ABX8ZZK2_9SPHN|nr:L,D-transpeptidase family protein [Qipengyuania gelatinilytica]QZD94460.1 L,D-transpeptidase family protein [Qipengyuania gelatinilytica]
MRKPILLSGAALIAAGLFTAASAQDAAPESILPRAEKPEKSQEPVSQAPQTVEEAFGDIRMQSGEVVQEVPSLEGVWTAEQVQQLIDFIPTLTAEGLRPEDYRLGELQALAAEGESEALNVLASETFVWLVEDLRDGRTPMESRRQWFVVDPDADRMPTWKLLEDALASGEIAGTLTGLHPVHPDYAALREELVTATDPARIKLIRANMDRWRWLPQDLGKQYLMTNVPEYMLRLTVNGRIIKSYRTVVGKPGRTATPQLSEMVEAIIFNPTWTVPQSIVVGEGLGNKVLSNPQWAASQGYKATKGAGGWIGVVQQPGPLNALGLMKLDMPNEHAIFLHDTPSRHLFNQANRALSHGCIRVEGALEVAMTMAMLGNATSKAELPDIQQEVTEISASREYTRYPMAKQWPVYITYFTMATDVNGEMKAFKDIYDRDKPVLEALDAPRVSDRARETSEEAVEIIDDMQITA